MTAKAIEALLLASDTAVMLASEAREAERRRCQLIVEEVNAHASHVAARLALAMVHKRIQEGTPHDAAANYPFDRSHACVPVTKLGGGGTCLAGLRARDGHQPERLQGKHGERPVVEGSRSSVPIAIRILIARIKLRFRIKEIRK